MTVFKNLVFYISIGFANVLTNCSSDQQEAEEQVGEDGQQEDKKDSAKDTAASQQAQNDAAANSLQQKEAGTGESVNNTPKDQIAQDLSAQTASPAADALLPPVVEQAPPTTLTYTPGNVPAGWARTQNGLFINMSNLSDLPLNYLEPRANWH